jgi:hypothetical protein
MYCHLSENSLVLYILSIIYNLSVHEPIVEVIYLRYVQEVYILYELLDVVAVPFRHEKYFHSIADIVTVEIIKRIQAFV